MSRLAFLLFLTLLGANPALSETALSGWFVAKQPCEAYQSKNALTNPAEVRLSVGVAYRLLGINKTGGAWYRIEVRGAPVTQSRWVRTSCGTRDLRPPGPPGASEAAGTGPAQAARQTATDLLLALSWEPAFCEAMPFTAECRRLNAGKLPTAATRLSLHGLWPQPEGKEYCGVPAHIRSLDSRHLWSRLPAPGLDADTAGRLAVAMPGTASFLERHEWIRHGTCFSALRNGDAYFDDALFLLDAVNRSAVGRFLARNLGSRVRTTDLRRAFDTAFGQGAGDRVQVSCKEDQGRQLITELRIALRGQVDDTADIGELIRNAPRQSPGCSGGVIDTAGRQ